MPTFGAMELLGLRPVFTTPGAVPAQRIEMLGPYKTPAPIAARESRHQATTGQTVQ